ncbi:MAG: flagellar basal-body rod protein FlgB [Phycisphaerales bacterium]|nr:flagellar basal-body rod protein FlgB [Phycisphaerales bacterium]
MFVDRMLNQGNGPLLEQWLRFTQTRHRLIAENVVNISTPGYQAADLDEERFRSLLRERADARAADGPDAASFDDVAAEVSDPERGMLFHDGQARSMEQLMTDQAKNAMTHNLVIELLRKQFSALEMALKERVS